MAQLAQVKRPILYQNLNSPNFKFRSFSITSVFLKMCYFAVNNSKCFSSVWVSISVFNSYSVIAGAACGVTDNCLG